MWVPKIPSWSALTYCGRSRILRSSYVWIIAVPLLAQLLQGVNRDFQLSIFGNPVLLTLDLPFSWKMFYFGAIATALASLIYSSTCPNIIRDYERYWELSREGKGARQITRALLEAAASHSILDPPRQGSLLMRVCRKRRFPDFGVERRRGFLGEFLQRYSSNYPGNEPDPAEAWVLSHQTKIEPAKLAEAFWYVRDIADRTSTWARIAAVSCYAIAFCSLGVVLLQNFLFVLRFTAGDM